MRQGCAVYPPVDIAAPVHLFERTRDLALSGDGGNLYGSFRSERHELRWSLSAGEPNAGEKNDELALFGADMPGMSRLKCPYLGQLIYELDAGR